MAALSILLVTQDIYLSRGIREFFPELISLNTIDRTVFKNTADKYVILIDSRSPLFLYEYLIHNSVRMRKIILCIMLDMKNQEQENQLPPLKFMKTSLMSLDMLPLFSLLISLNGKIIAEEWLDTLTLTPQETKMLQLLVNGTDIEDVANALNISVKGLYRMRTALCERLQVDNFNKACLFIFKNKLFPPSQRSELW